VTLEPPTRCIINILININTFTTTPSSFSSNYQLLVAFSPSALSPLHKFLQVYIRPTSPFSFQNFRRTTRHFPAMHFLTSVSLVSAFFALSSASPILNERSDDFCPGMLHYKPSDTQCPSGFLGCVAYADGDETCGGPKRFFNDCSGGPGLGSFYNCANGFRGCSTNPRICDTKSSASTPSVTPPSNPPSTSTTCPPSTWYAGPNECPSGFVGCTGENKYCEGPKRFWGTCPPDHGTYVVCNGFVGCTTDKKICG
jgi:hypothetical protein